MEFTKDKIFEVFYSTVAFYMLLPVHTDKKIYLI